MAKNKAIIISTHILEEVEAVCSRAVIIAQGRVVFDGSPIELQRRSHHHNAVSIRVEAESAAKLASEIAALPGVERIESVEGGNGLVTLIAFPEKDRQIIHDVSVCVRASGIELDEIQAERGDLTEVFRSLTIGT
jgi:ABC-2 type transport system ATP-binding protein